LTALVNTKELMGCHYAATDYDEWLC